MKKNILSLGIFVAIVIALFNFSNFAEAKTVRLVKTANDPKVYLVDNNRRVHIPNEQVFEAGGYKWNEIKTISDSEMNKISNTALIKSPVDAKVYLVKDGNKQWIPNETTFLGAGYKWDDIVLISQAQVNFYNESTFVKTQEKVEIAPVDNAKKVTPTSTESSNDDQAKLLELDGTEADYSQSEEQRSNNYLSKEKSKLLSNDYLRFVKAYPNLTIMGVNNVGDYVGCLGKSDYDIHRAFAVIKGKLYIIGTIDGIYACANDINDKGQVVGHYSYKEGKDKAFLWENGKITKLPWLDVTDGGDVRSYADAISNDGIIVGMSLVQTYEKSGNEIVHAVRWVNGQIEDLVDNNTQYTNKSTWAMDINDNEQILLTLPGGFYQVIFWQNGKIVEVEKMLPTSLGDNEYVKAKDNIVEYLADGSVALDITKITYWSEFVNGEDRVKSSSTTKYSRIVLPNDITKI